MELEYDDWYLRLRVLKLVDLLWRCIVFIVVFFINAFLGYLLALHPHITVVMMTNDDDHIEDVHFIISFYGAFIISPMSDTIARL